MVADANDGERWSVVSLTPLPLSVLGQLETNANVPTTGLGTPQCQPTLVGALGWRRMVQFRTRFFVTPGKFISPRRHPSIVVDEPSPRLDRQDAVAAAKWKTLIFDSLPFWIPSALATRDSCQMKDQLQDGRELIVEGEKRQGGREGKDRRSLRLIAPRMLCFIILMAFTFTQLNDSSCVPRAVWVRR